MDDTTYMDMTYIDVLLQDKFSTDNVTQKLKFTFPCLRVESVLPVHFAARVSFFLGISLKHSALEQDTAAGKTEYVDSALQTLADGIIQDLINHDISVADDSFFIIINICKSEGGVVKIETRSFLIKKLSN